MEHLFFTGVVEFSSATKIDKFGKYSLNVLLNEDSLEKYKKSGIQGKLTEKPNGQSVIFSRQPTRVNRKSGEIMQFGPPKIVDKIGNPTDLFVNRGDPVTVKVTVYNTDKGVGCTMESVLLLDKEGTWADQEKKHDPEYTGLRF